MYVFGVVYSKHVKKKDELETTNEETQNIQPKLPHVFRYYLGLAIAFKFVICLTLFIQCGAYILIFVGAVMEFFGLVAGLVLFIIGNLVVVSVIYSMLVMAMMLYTPRCYIYTRQMGSWFIQKVKKPATTQLPTTT